MTREAPAQAIFLTRVHDRDGNLKHDGKPRRNTRTTGADWRSCRNWQTTQMSGAGATANDGEDGVATGAAATTLTNTGAAFPTANDGYNGHIVVATGTTRCYGVIVSNTATILTIDKWYNPASPGGAAVGPPSATTPYVILPGSAPAWWLALSTSGTTPTASDTTLASEITTGGLARAVWTTLTFTSGGSSFTMQNVFTATSTFTVNSEAVFNAANTTAGGAMPFAALEPNPPTLVSGDTLTQQIQITIG